MTFSNTADLALGMRFVLHTEHHNPSFRHQAFTSFADFPSGLKTSLDGSTACVKTFVGKPEWLACHLTKRESQFHWPFSTENIGKYATK